MLHRTVDNDPSISVTSDTQPFTDISIYDGYGQQRSDQWTDMSGDLQYAQADPVGFEGQYGYYGDYEFAQTNSNTTTKLYLRQQPYLLTHRYYDPGTGRFINRDPIGYNGGINQYAYCGGNPIMGKDPSGYKIIYRQNVFNHETLAQFNRHKKEYLQAIDYLVRDKEMLDRYKALKNSKTTYTIYFNDSDHDYFSRGDKSIHWDSHSALRTVDNTIQRNRTGKQTPALGLGHELMGHAYLYNIVTDAQYIRKSTPTGGAYSNDNEKWVIEGIERQFALHIREHPRHNHDGIPYRVKNPIIRNN